MVSILSAALALRTGTVKVHGHDVTIRALSETDILNLDRLYPEPLPPTIKNPNAGTLSAPIENPTDPEYRRERGRWQRRRWLNEVVIATGEQVEGSPAYKPDGDDSTNRAAIDAAAKAVAAVLTETELFRVWNQMRDLFDEKAHAAARASLVVDLDDDALEVREAEKLPSNYGTTMLYRKMRAFERFGQLPTAVDPGLMVQMIEYDTVRQQEEARAPGAL